MNNLFWEVSKNWQTGKRVSWGGNIFRNGLVDLSALYLSTNYVLLSVGSTLGIEKLAKYGKAKKWKIVGITGPKDEVEQLAKLWGGKTVLSKLRKRFRSSGIICHKFYRLYFHRILRGLGTNPKTKSKFSNSTKRAASTCTTTPSSNRLPRTA